MAETPLISVCMVTYQHEKYVGDAVRSVLNQTFQDSELIIVNDGSNDETVSRISQIHDPRIRLINQVNQGPAAATNTAIAAARGKYVALFSGDDLCHPNRLQMQLDEVADHPERVLFSDVDFVDDDGRPISGEHFAASLFANTQLTRAQTLARLFHHGNFLNGVTTFARREVFGVAPYDRTLLQLQDFDLWVRLASHCDLHVISDPLVSYRIRSGGGNLSAPSADAVIRSANEHFLVLRRFFDGVPLPLFREAFGDLLIRPEMNDSIDYQCELAFLFLNSTIPMARAIGVERIHALMRDPRSAQVLSECYRYTPLQFFEQMRRVDAFNLLGGHCSTIFLDTGPGWVAGHEVRLPINPYASEFTLRFELPASPGLKSLRWDPIEGRMCRVHLEAIECRWPDGHIVGVDLAGLGSNGDHVGDGTFEFETKDPMLWWPVEEGVTQVSVRGRWEFDYLGTKVLRLQDDIDQLKADLEAATISRKTKLLKFARRAMAKLKAG